MKIAYIIFDQITWLDMIGVYDAISRLKIYNYLPDLSWEICALSETSGDAMGLSMLAQKIKPSLADYDAIIVPGGYGTRALQADESFIEWIRTASNVPLKVSICTGSLLLGAAGFLKGKKATTNFNEYASLQPYCREMSEERIVEDDGVITAGAVSASIDLGLYLCNKWAGKEAAEFIRKKMDYHG